jgi:rhodanese-related sulfurtransferase
MRGRRAAAVGIDDHLAEVRRGLDRMTPQQAYAATEAGSLLVDTRMERQRAAQGELPGALVVDRTVLEWRLDPASDSRLAIADSYDLAVIVICAEGYSSSLAAGSLRAIGLHRSTDVIDGVVGWQRAGLPLSRMA